MNNNGGQLAASDLGADVNDGEQTLGIVSVFWDVKVKDTVSFLNFENFYTMLECVCEYAGEHPFWLFGQVEPAPVKVSPLQCQPEPGLMGKEATDAYSVGTQI